MHTVTQYQGKHQISTFTLSLVASTTVFGSHSNTQRSLRTTVFWVCFFHLNKCYFHVFSRDYEGLSVRPPSLPRAVWELPLRWEGSRSQHLWPLLHSRAWGEGTGVRTPPAKDFQNQHWGH